MAGIRIDDLPATALPSLDHEFPAMKDGITVKLKVQQIADMTAPATHAADSKATPADADEFALADSADGWSLKKLTWANIKAALSSAFLPKSGGAMTGGLSFGSEYAASPQSNARHIALYSTTHGFNVTADYLNYHSANRHRWLVGGFPKVIIDDTRLTMLSGVGLRLSDDPSHALDAATKQYVDTVKWTEIAPVATTSGTAIDWTSIPAGVSEIELWFDRVSVNSTAHILLQVGTGGVPKADGYVSASGLPGSTFRTTSTAGFVVYSNVATGSLCGAIRLRRMQGDTWVAEHNLGFMNNDGVGSAGGGSVTLSGNLDMLRLTSVGGTQTFDAGSVQVRYR